MKRLVRLNKVLARAGVCSRRKADLLISSGQVFVNNEPVQEMGIMVDPDDDRITVLGREISFGRPEPVFVYAVLNKPIQVVTTVSDPQGRKTVIDLLPPELKKIRLFPVGRLDYFSQGLIILTNDGVLAHRLTHPSWNHARVYRVTVRERVDNDQINIMTKGMLLKDGTKLAPVKIKIISRKQDSTIFEISLNQGINRQIRKMCHDLGLTILRLVRITQGPVQLGKLNPGQVRLLEPGEISALRKSLDMVSLK